MSLSLVSCTSSKTESIDENSDENIEVDAKSLYVLHCESCHGLDGKRGTSGAADLSKSTFSDKEILHVIENGNDKGMMPYKELISSKNERNSLMEYVKTLRK
ncbi:MAG: cytochrome c [Bacteroidota bacterium]